MRRAFLWLLGVPVTAVALLLTLGGDGRSGGTSQHAAAESPVAAPVFTHKRMP